MIEISFIYQNIINYIEPYLSIVIPQIMQKFFRNNSQTTNAFIDFLMNLTKTSPSVIQFMPLIAYHFSLLLNQCSYRHIQCKPCLRVKICNCIVLFIITFKRQFISSVVFEINAIKVHLKQYSVGNGWDSLNTCSTCTTLGGSSLQYAVAG